VPSYRPCRSLIMHRVTHLAIEQGVPRGAIDCGRSGTGHANAKTTGLYDRRNDDISVSEVERIGI